MHLLAISTIDLLDLHRRVWYDRQFGQYARERGCFCDGAISVAYHTYRRIYAPSVEVASVSTISGPYSCKSTRHSLGIRTTATSDSLTSVV